MGTMDSRTENISVIFPLLSRSLCVVLLLSIRPSFALSLLTELEPFSSMAAVNNGEITEPSMILNNSTLLIPLWPSSSSPLSLRFPQVVNIVRERERGSRSLVVPLKEAVRISQCNEDSYRGDVIRCLLRDFIVPSGHHLTWYLSGNLSH